ncbi:MAG: EAL domain-containing protein [Spongiibacteraceae bacterium]
MSNAESVRDLVGWLNQREFQRAPVPETSSGAGDTFEHPLHIADNAVHSTYAGLQLGTLFQPIVRGTTVIAHEALLTIGATPVNTAQWRQHGNGDAAGTPQDAQEIIYFDRLTRTLHTLNFLAQDARGDLHLNVDAHHLLAVTANHGHVFEQIIRQCGLHPERIVLEIPEHSIRDKDRLHEAIAAWQSRRYRIAIDGFGQQHAQLARVLALRPDVLKIDGNFWQKQLGAPASRQKLRETLDRIAERGIAVILNGVDTAAAQESLVLSGIPLAIATQGDRVGIPQPWCHPQTIAAIDASPTRRQRSA